MALGPTDPPAAKVALVHDYLTQRGGAERVVALLCETFPQAPLHTSFYEPPQTFAEFENVDVRASRLNRIASFRRDPRTALALLAPTFSTMRVDADVVLATSSGWAHGVKTSAPLVVYCFAPARWLYQSDRYVGTPGSSSKGFQRLAKTAITLGGSALRSWDQRAAHRAERYLTTSHAAARMIKDAYGFAAEVVPPPPALEHAGPVTPVEGLEPGFILTVSRLLPYKNVDVTLEVARRRPHQQLVVVGDGPLREALERDAPPNVRFIQGVDDATLRWLYAQASVLIAPSFEDYGLTPLEAASMGTPTVALRAGGYLDTIIGGETGIFFDSIDPVDIINALDQAAPFELDPSVLRGHAARFSRERFASRMQAVINEVAP